MTRALDTVFGWMPYRSTTQMGAGSKERIDALLIAHHPYPLLRQHAGADLAHLIVLWLTRSKFLQRFVQDPREEKAH